jgi:CcmD family protein
MKALFSLFVFLLATTSSFAQSADDKLFETLHGHGSFNVVFTVLLIILLGVLVYIWRLDRKVTKLLNEVKK